MNKILIITIPTKLTMGIRVSCAAEPWLCDFQTFSAKVQRRLMRCNFTGAIVIIIAQIPTERLYWFLASLITPNLNSLSSICTILWSRNLLLATRITYELIWECLKRLVNTVNWKCLKGLPISCIMGSEAGLEGGSSWSLGNWSSMELDWSSPTGLWRDTISPAAASKIPPPALVLLLPCQDQCCGRTGRVRRLESYKSTQSHSPQCLGL